MLRNILYRFAIEERKPARGVPDRFGEFRPVFADGLSIQWNPGETCRTIYDDGRVIEIIARVKCDQNGIPLIHDQFNVEGDVDEEVTRLYPNTVFASGAA